MKTTFPVALLIASFAGYAAEQGIPVVPNEEGVFEYVDDFDTPGFLREAFVEGLRDDSWTPGAVVNCGPHSSALTYRFHGNRVIEKAEVRVGQAANGRHLGGRNALYLSTNGLDWVLVASSGDQDPDQNGWQREPLTLSPEHADELTGGSEVWLRIALVNYSGLKTNVSNRIDSIEVRFVLGEETGQAADPQAKARTAWGKMRRKANWRALALDWADPLNDRAPHYYEDTDGWLERAGANELLPNEADGFHISRTYCDGHRPALALAVFVALGESTEPIMARIIVRCNRGAHRQLLALWDGEPVAEFDAAGYFEAGRDFFVNVSGPHKPGVHELRLTGADAGHAALIRRIEVVGEAVEGWAEKPPLPDGGSLEILSAYYMPDPAPPEASQAVEGRQEVEGINIAGMQRLYEEHADFGAVRVVFRNGGTVPVRIGNTIELNGKPVEESYVDFVESPWDARGVVWRRVWPRTLAPGQCGQAYIRFRRRPEGDHAAVVLPLENGPAATAAIPYVDPGVAVDYVTTGKDARTLYVYARRTGNGTIETLEAISLDGETIERVSIYGADFPGNVALAVAQLDAPLVEGSYHVVGVETGNGPRIATQFRVLPFFFPRSSIHVPVELAKSMHMNLLTWRMHGLEVCEKYGLPTTCMHSDVLNVHSRVPLIFAPDEPDAKDNRGGGYDKGLGWHARMLEHSGWQDLVATRSPPVASWMNMDGTVRPLNWAVYGQFSDVNGFDPYPVNFYGADHAYVRESLSYVRRCCAPTRMYAILEAFGWGAGQGVPSGARGPIPAEYRQNVVQAIGAGMKGLTSWVHSPGAGGWALDEGFADEIATANALIETIEELLLIGTPIDLATSDAGLVPTGTVDKEHWPKERVWVGSLLCGPETIVVAVANHIPASKPGPPAIEPARNVTVTVRLPDFIREATAREATRDGLTSFPCRLENGRAFLDIESIESGRVFVLQRVER